MEVFFASDLSRVGARADLGSADRPLVGAVIGRDAPELFSLGARSPIGDPCVSRKQLSVSWDPTTGVFDIADGSATKRNLSAFTLAGAPMPPGEPGPRLVAIGDRALLLFAIRRPEPPTTSTLLGNGDAMRALRERIVDVANHPEVALVTGPTGSGKELVAREIHARSRRVGPFLAVNAAALPADLVESELFGHVKGAFSGATGNKSGLFQAASTGTLTLDEMGELPLSLQAKLLRAVELKAIRPVGGNREVDVDVRIIAATNRDLMGEVDAGRFRADLYQRLLGLHVVVPPIEQHREDLALLFVTFLRSHLDASSRDRFFRPATTDPTPLPLSFFLALLRHPFPGNVREVDRLALDVATRGNAALREVETRRESILPEAAAGSRQRPSREELLASLQRHGHVQHRVARELGIPYATLDRWLREASVLRPRDLSEQDIRSQLKTSGSVEAAAKALGVSLRGLKLRVIELGILPDRSSNPLLALEKNVRAQ